MEEFTPEESRDSIVSSDSGVIRMQQRLGIRPSHFTSREQWRMNRFEWISYVQVLFAQLKQTTVLKVVRVELSNFVSALKKILPLLPLSDKVEDWEKSLSYRQVLDSVT